jgi:hypothetical protein
VLLLHLLLKHLLLQTLLLCCLALHQRSCWEGLQVLQRCCLWVVLLQGCQRSQGAGLKLLLRQAQQQEQHAWGLASCRTGWASLLLLEVLLLLC